MPLGILENNWSKNKEFWVGLDLGIVFVDLVYCKLYKRGGRGREGLTTLAMTRYVYIIYVICYIYYLYIYIYINIYIYNREGMAGFDIHANFNAPALERRD